MDGSLLSAKLYIPPPRPAGVERPRLLARLDAGSDGGKLILICAPAGFGKTSLLVDWLHARGRPGDDGLHDAAPAARLPRRAAWVSLDAADNAPTRFWCYVMAALEVRCPASGRCRSRPCRRPSRHLSRRSWPW